MEKLQQEKIDAVLEELARQIHPEGPARKVAPTTHLEYDLGVGSLERLELVQRLEKALGFGLPARGVFAASTVLDLYRLVENPQAIASETEERTLEPFPELLPPLPESAVCCLESIEMQAAQQPARGLLIFEHDGQHQRTLTLPELLVEVQSLAGGLKKLGVGPGDRVGLMLPTGLPFVASFFAVQWLGAIPVPLYPPFRPDQAEDFVKRQAAILDNAGVQVLVSFARAWSMAQLLKLHSRSLRQLVAADSLLSRDSLPRYQSGPDELGLIQYTSGSTGLPKGVALTHANLLHNIRAYGKALQVRHDDVCVSWLPLYHDMGLIGSMLGSLYHGIPLVLMAPQDFLARPSRWLWALHHYHGSISPAPNFAYELCARRVPEEEIQGLDLGRWRVALNGAEPVRQATLEAFTQRYGPSGFRQSSHFPAYGLAEAALAVAFSPLDRGPKVDRISQLALEREQLARAPEPEEAFLELVSAGFPLEGTEIVIRDAQGRGLPERREGRLFFRSGSSLQSYFDNPQATREVKDAEGWVATGDLAYLAEGELYITGRSKDLIIKAGRNLHPQDIEAVVAEVPGVRRGCVASFGSQDVGGGSELLVVVFETRNKGSEAERLCQEVRRRVGETMGVTPDRVVGVAPGLLPKTPSGKIRRGECLRRFRAGTLARKSGVLSQVARLVVASPEGRRQFARGFWDAATLFGLVGTPGLLLSQVAPRRALQALPGACRAWLKISGLPLTVHGSLPPGPHLVVSNHASLIDALVLMAACHRPLHFLVAPWIYDHPILARGLRKMGHLKVTRGDTEGAARLASEVGDLLARGHSLATFPEGGIETSQGLRPFASGAFWAAAQAGLPVVPVVLKGTRQALPWPKLILTRGPLEVIIGPALRPAEASWQESLTLARLSREWIGERCGEPLVEERLRRRD